MEPVGQWLWYANLAALAALLVRLALTRLYKIYPFMFVYFLVMLSVSVALTRIPLRTTSYSYAYMACQAVLQILAILVVLEMYRVALVKHAGLAGFGRASVLTVTLCTISVAAVGTLLDKNILSGQSAIVHRFLTLERTLDLIVVVFLLLIAVFITWFPVELSRNVALSIGGFSVFYLARAAGLLTANLLPPAYYLTVNSAMMSASLLILAGWAFLLRPDKARIDSAVAGHSWDPAALGRVSRQLDAINAALVRFARR